MNAVNVIVIFAVQFIIIASTEAWPMIQQPPQQTIKYGDSCPTPSSSHPSSNSDANQQNMVQRRNFISTIMSTTTTTATTIASVVMTTAWMMPETAMASTTTTSKVTEAAIQELKESRNKLKEIPDLLEANEWDKVRSILKVPPVNKLWNLGDVRFGVLF